MIHMIQHGAFLAAGFLAVAAQVLLLRELVVDVAGDELAIGVGLGAWLLGIALGAAAGRRRPPRRAARDAAWGIAVLAVLSVLGVLAGRISSEGRIPLAPGPHQITLVRPRSKKKLSFRVQIYRHRRAASGSHH